MTPTKKLIVTWREEAQTLRIRYGDEGKARLAESCARDLEIALREEEQQQLTIKESSVISRYSVSHLRRMMDQGRLTNVGAPGAPRLLRSELPFKPKCASGSHASRAAVNAKQERAVTAPSTGFRILRVE